MEFKLESKDVCFTSQDKMELKEIFSLKGALSEAQKKTEDINDIRREYANQLSNVKGKIYKYFEELLAELPKDIAVKINMAPYVGNVYYLGNETHEKILSINTKDDEIYAVLEFGHNTGSDFIALHESIEHKILKRNAYAKPLWKQSRSLYQDKVLECIVQNFKSIKGDIYAGVKKALLEKQQKIYKEYAEVSVGLETIIKSSKEM